MALPGAGDPVEAFLAALCRYLRDRGGMLLSLAGATGQEEARVALLALYRRHEPEETGYLRFEHVLAALEDCGEPCMDRLRAEAGLVGFEREGREAYAVFRLDKLRRLMERCRA